MNINPSMIQLKSPGCFENCSSINSPSRLMQNAVVFEYFEESVPTTFLNATGAKSPVLVLVEPLMITNHRM